MSVLRRCILIAALLFSSCGFLAAEELFFENPRLLVEERSRFPVVESVGDRLVALFQERDPDGEELHVRTLISESGRDWEEGARFGGPVSFSSAEPNVFSSAVGVDDRIFVAVGTSATETVIYESSDYGESFDEIATLTTAETGVAPIISGRHDGGLVLFINQDVEAQQSIYAAASDDGREWSSFEQIETDDPLSLSFLPTHASSESRDILIFQGLETGTGMGYQLYVTESFDGGRTWETASRFTDFANPGSSEDPNFYDNQRPSVFDTDDGLYLTWERRFERESSRVFSARIEEDLRATDIRQVSPGLRSANSPQLFEMNGSRYYLWFEDRAGQREIVLAEPDRTQFRTRVVSDMSGNSTLPHAVFHRGRIHIFWQNEQNGRRSFAYLQPDEQVDPPQLIGNNFTDGSRTPRQTAEVQLRPPPDPSGIAGYSYVWTRDSDAEVPREMNVRGERSTLRLDTDEDGEWYLLARARDRAGNWSEPRRITFLRDLSRPAPVTFDEPDLDGEGFLTSNTFTISWTPENEDFVSGYTYSFSRVGAQTVTSINEERLPRPPSRIITTDTSISRENIDNGTYVLQVAAIDDIGNIGETERIVLRLNKYVPVTYVTRLTADTDILGRTRLEIEGRGFAEGGDIEQIILDRDGQEPWDYTFTSEDGSYEVVDDRRIDGPLIETIDSATYRLGLVHPERGTYFAPQPLTLEATGTVKFGDFTVRYSPTYVPRRSDYTLPMPALIIWLSTAMLAVIAVFSLIRMARIAREVSAMREDVIALMSGAPLPDADRDRRINRMKRKGIGLRLKFTAFFVTLVVSVVLLVALPLSNFIIGTQQRTLTDGLRERTNILLDSIVAGSVQFLPDAQENLFELNSLTFQTNPIPEALFATITEVRQGEELEEVVWASNDPRVTNAGRLSDDERISDTDSLLRGETRYSDDITGQLPDLVERIERDAREALGDIPSRIDELNRERIDIAISGEPDAEERVGEIDDIVTELETEQREILNDIGSIVSSVPQLSADTVLEADTTQYLFYKPIVYREIDGETFFHGLVRVAVSSERILGEISVAQQNLIRTTAIIGIAAIAVGILGALVLASIIVIPISRLVRGVEVIRDTDDKAKLSEHVIRLRSRDELRMLAEAINEMTQGLVKAAVANKDLTVGKEVQKMFIPLRTDSTGRKLTTAHEANEHIEFFGYYEGAKGVSGDYFNYRRLDSEHYALIKCDVAGKGVPAALIMVEVATIYMSYFRNWNSRLIDDLPNVMENINDLIEERGFQGRFAAFTLGILNERTGLVRVCNAGDTVLHTFRASSGKVEETTLPSLPAAGVFSSDLLPNGFPQVPHTLERGDILLLFTDGLEESKRFLRDESMRITTMTADDGNEVDNEELGIARIHEIVRAVEGQQKFRLDRAMTPESEILEFDFTSIEPTAENAVLALMAVEKVFRIVPNMEAGEEERIYVDVSVDDFLSATFVQYQDYFRVRDDARSSDQYRAYSNMIEDEQYDDLTILSVRKK